MKSASIKKQNSHTLIAAIAVSVALSLTACGGGSDSTDVTSDTTTTTPATTTTATPETTTTPTTPTKKVTNPNPSPYYYYDDAGQYHLQPGVTSGQAEAAGVLCRVRASEATRNSYLAIGRTVEWVDANITALALCPGY